MRALQSKGVKVNIISNLHAKPCFGLVWRFRWYKMFGKNYQYERTHCYTRQFGRYINARLSADADFVLATSTSALPYIKTTKPVFLYTDASFDNLAEYYSHFSNLPQSSRAMGDAVEKLAFENSSHLFFSSDWAATSAIKHYGVSPKKVSVIPFGANIEQVPTTDFVLESIAAKSLCKINIVWAGVEFERKGGPLALEFTKALRQEGFDASIVFIGVGSGQTGPLPNYAIATGFLAKDNVDHRKLMNEQFAKAHFFILPTTMDCSPVVLAEACAFGLPCLTTNISGISTIIRDGQNGFLFSPDAKASAYLAAIVPYLKTAEAYIQLAQNARLAYDLRLNWPTTASSLIDAMKKFV
jgi:glycosyltransferase involved in cell wall biosynthesis